MTSAKDMKVLAFKEGRAEERTVPDVDLSSGREEPVLEHLRAKLSSFLPEDPFLADENGKPLGERLDGSDEARGILCSLGRLTVLGRNSAAVPLAPSAPAASTASSGAPSTYEFEEEVDIPPHESIHDALQQDCSLEAAFGEFIDNAIQATRENSAERGRRITVTVDPERRVVSVEDNGVGITREEGRSLGRLSYSMNNERSEENSRPDMPPVPRLPQSPQERTQLMTQFISSHLMTGDISRYGLGMKRAGFYIGNRIVVTSKSDKCDFVVTVEFTKGKFKAMVRQRVADAQDVARGSFFRIEVSHELGLEDERERGKQNSKPFWSSYAALKTDTIMRRLAEKYTMYMRGGLVAGGSTSVPVTLSFVERRNGQDHATDLTKVFSDTIENLMTKTHNPLPNWARSVSAWKLYAELSDKLDRALFLPLPSTDREGGDSTKRICGMLVLHYFPRRNGRETNPGCDEAESGQLQQLDADASAMRESRVITAWNGLLLVNSPVNEYTQELQGLLPFMVPPPRSQLGKYTRRKEHIKGVDAPFRCFLGRVMGILFLHEAAKIDTQKIKVVVNGPIVKEYMLLAPKQAQTKLWEQYAHWVAKMHREHDQEVTWAPDRARAIRGGEEGAVQVDRVEFGDAPYAAGDKVKYVDDAAEAEEDEEEEEGAAAGEGESTPGPSSRPSGAGSSRAAPLPSSVTPQTRKGKGKRAGASTPEPRPSPLQSAAKAKKTRVGTIARFVFPDKDAMDGLVEIEPLRDVRWPEFHPDSGDNIQIPIAYLRGKPSAKEIQEAERQVERLSPARVEIVDRMLPSELRAGDAQTIQCRFVNGQEEAKPMLLNSAQQSCLGVLVAAYAQPAAFADSGRESQEAVIQGAPLSRETLQTLDRRSKSKLVVAVAIASPVSVAGASLYKPFITLFIPASHTIVVHAIRKDSEASSWSLDKRIPSMETTVKVTVGDIDEIAARWDAGAAAGPTLPFGVLAPPLELLADDKCGNAIRGDWRPLVPRMRVTCRSAAKHFEVKMQGDSLALSLQDGRLLASGFYLAPCPGEPHERLRTGADPSAEAALQVCIEFEGAEEGASGAAKPPSRPEKYRKDGLPLKCRVTAGPPAELELRLHRRFGSRAGPQEERERDELIETLDGAAFPKLEVEPRDAWGYRSTLASAGYHVAFDLSEANGALVGPANAIVSLQQAAGGRGAQAVEVVPPFTVKAPPGTEAALLLRVAGELSDALRHGGLAAAPAAGPSEKRARRRFKVSLLKLQLKYTGRAPASRVSPAGAGQAGSKLRLRLSADEGADVAGLEVEAVADGRVVPGYEADRTSLVAERKPLGLGAEDDEDDAMVELFRDSSATFKRGRARLAPRLPDELRPLREPALLRYRFAVADSATLSAEFDILWLPARPERAEIVAGNPIAVLSGGACGFQLRVLDGGGEGAAPVRGRRVQLHLNTRSSTAGLHLDLSGFPGAATAAAGAQGGRLSLRTDEGGVARVEGLVVKGPAGAEDEVEVVAVVDGYKEDGTQGEFPLPAVTLRCRVVAGPPTRLELAKEDTKVVFGGGLRLGLTLRDREGNVADFDGPAQVSVEELGEQPAPFPAGARPLQVQFVGGVAEYEGPAVPRPVEALVRGLRARVTLVAGALRLHAECGVTVTGDESVFLRAALLYSYHGELREVLPFTATREFPCVAGEALPQLEYRLVNEVNGEWPLPEGAELRFWPWAAEAHGLTQCSTFPAGEPYQRSDGVSYTVFRIPEGHPAPTRAGKYRLYVFPSSADPDPDACSTVHVVVRHGPFFCIGAGSATPAPARAAAPAAGPSNAVPASPAAAARSLRVPVLQPGALLEPMELELLDRFDNVCDSLEAPVEAELRIELLHGGEILRLELQGPTIQRFVRGRARFDGIRVVGEGPTSHEWRIRFVPRGAGFGDTPLPDHDSLPAVTFVSALESAAEKQRVAELVAELNALKQEIQAAQARLNGVLQSRRGQEEQLKNVERDIRTARGMRPYPQAYSDPNFDFAAAINAERARLEAASRAPARAARLFPPGTSSVPARSAQRLRQGADNRMVRGFLGFLAEMGRVEDDVHAEAIARHLGSRMQWAIFEDQRAVDAVKRSPQYEELMMLGVGGLATSDRYRGQLAPGDPQGRLALPPIPGQYRGQYMVNLVHLDEGRTGDRGTIWWYALRESILFDSVEDLVRYREEVMHGRLDRTLVALVREGGRVVGIEEQRSGPQRSGAGVGREAAPGAFAGLPVQERPAVAETRNLIAALERMRALRENERRLEAALAGLRREEAEGRRLFGELDRRSRQLSEELAEVQRAAREREGGGGGEGEGSDPRGKRKAAGGAGGAAGPSGPKRSRR
eukprot:tig00000093_g3511.t1